MSQQSEQSADLEDLKKQLEAMAGRKLDFSAEQLRSLWFPAGAQDYTDGTVTWEGIYFPRKSCNAATLFDASGESSTGSDGKRVFLLSDVTCLPQLRSLAEPINVLATARSSRPFFVTTDHALIDNGNDVQITVFAWDAGGAAAPNVSFDWRCRVVSNQIIV